MYYQPINVHSAFNDKCNAYKHIYTCMHAVVYMNAILYANNVSTQQQLHTAAAAVTPSLNRLKWKNKWMNEMDRRLTASSAAWQKLAEGELSWKANTRLSTLGTYVCTCVCWLQAGVTRSTAHLGVVVITMQNSPLCNALHLSSSVWDSPHKSPLSSYASSLCPSVDLTCAGRFDFHFQSQTQCECCCVQNAMRLQFVPVYVCVFVCKCLWVYRTLLGCLCSVRPCMFVC